MISTGKKSQLHLKLNELFGSDDTSNKDRLSFYQYIHKYLLIGYDGYQPVYNISYLDVALKAWKLKQCKEIKMTGNEYQRLAARTINNDLNNPDLELHALHGMVGEIGEIHSMYQKVYQGHEFSFEHLKKELGDLMWFIAEFCTASNISLDDIMQMNIDKLKARFPDGFESVKSVNRRKGDI